MTRISFSAKNAAMLRDRTAKALRIALRGIHGILQILFVLSD